MTLELELEVSWRLGVHRAQPVPDLLFVLLQEIDQHGSIGTAAKRCDISYRSAWNLLNQWQDQLGTSLVITHQGRGTTLDLLGRKLLWGYQYAKEQSAPPLRAVRERVIRECQEAADQLSSPGIRIYASHCLSHPVLCDMLEHETRIRPRMTHGGSARCLEHLSAGDCTMAGFHLAEGPLAVGFIRHYLQFFAPGEYRVVQAVRRRQGLMIKPGNPRQITGLNDLTRDDLQFVNRQANSGTRMLLDLLLESQSIDNTGIRGYDHIEFTHSAVSAMVAGDRADVGIGTEAAAVAFDLDFIPLATEVYYYAVRRSEWQHPGVRAVRAVLGGARWRQAISVMDGFDSTESGTSLDADELVARYPLK